MMNKFFYQKMLSALLIMVSYSNVWSQVTVNLNTHYTGIPPAGTTFEWHNGLPISTGNALTTANASAAPVPGVYYGVFYDAANSCYSPSTRVKVVTNNCPVLTVDLTQQTSSTAPSGTVLEWHTSSSPSATSLVATPNAVSSGTYWAVFHDTVNNCYSPVSSPVIVVTNLCACYKPAVTAGTLQGATFGITALNRASANNGSWPNVRKGAWIALESKTKGFVPNRLTSAQVAAIPATDLVEGMMIYNTDLDCLQINTDGTSTGWTCFNKQTCPDN